MNKPDGPGWHWFLPEAGSRSPIDRWLWREHTPVVLLVGIDKVTRGMPPARMVVRFPQGMVYVDDMPGDWEPIAVPERLHVEAQRRLQARERSKGGERDE